MPAVDLNPAGTLFVRAAIAAALEPEPHGRIGLATKRWGAGSKIVQCIKDAVAGAGTGDADFSALLSARDFIRAADSLTVLGRASGWRFVAPNVPVAIQGDDAAGSWRHQGEAIPMSRSAFDRWVPTSRTAAVLAVFARELFNSSDPQSESVIRGDMLRAVAKLTDQAMFGPSGDGSDGAPVSLIYNLTPIANDGTLEGAVEAAVGAFKGDLSRAIWAIEPQTAARVGITSGGRGMAVDLGARGGTLAGLAAYASVGMPRDELVLIDPGRVGVVDEGIDFNVTESASIELRDDPEQNAQTPAAAGAGHEVVSLFQTDDIGIKLVRRINWKAATDAVVRVEFNSSGS